jgi:hypothetical protein
LASADPDGARACETLGRWLREGRVTHEFETVREAARYASGAKTGSIRATVNGVADVPRPGHPGEFDGVPLVDLRQLHRACRAAGVDLPPYPG